MAVRIGLAGGVVLVTAGWKVKIPGCREAGAYLPWSQLLRVWLRRLTGPRLFLTSGFAVIVAGVFCLFLSGVVAAPGSWWQGTLDAFGVGFAVGGLVDVLAMFGLNRFATAADLRREENNREAREILSSYAAGKNAPLGWDAEADVLVEAAGYLIDPGLRRRLEALVSAERGERFSAPSGLLASRRTGEAWRSSGRDGR